MPCRILGAVLAGGASSRFGSDKAVALLAGRTLIDHAAALLEPHVTAVVVVGRGEVPDVPRAGLGPLGGIAGALAEAERRGCASVLTVACDMVHLPEGLLAAVLDRSPSYCGDAPVLGHWPVSTKAALLERLAPHPSSSRPGAGIHGAAGVEADILAARWTPGRAGGDEAKMASGRHRRDASLSVRRWATSIGAVAIPSPAPIANINTPDDLATL